MVLHRPVDVDDILVLGQLQSQVLGLLHVVAADDDRGPEVPTRLDLDDRRHGGHDHRHWYVQPLAVIAQGLRVIAQRRGYHAVPFVFVRQHHQRVASAAFFEAKSGIDIVFKKKKNRAVFTGEWGPDCGF